MATIDVEIENNEDPNFLDHQVYQDDNLLNYKDPIINEYFNQIAGIGMAVNALEDLARIEAKANSMSVIDAQTMKIARIAIENIKQSTGLNFTTPALEDNATKEIALEGLGDAIKAIFEAIWKAIRAVISFFGSFFTSAKKEKAKVDNKETKKEVEKKTKEKAKPKKDTLEASVFEDIEPEKNVVTISDITERCTELKQSVKIAQILVKEFFTFVERMGNVYNSYAHQKNMNIGDLDNAAIDLNDIWNKTILSALEPIKDRSLYSEELGEIKEKFDQTSSQVNQIRCISGFIKGRLFIGYPRFSTKRNYEAVHLDVISPNVIEGSYTGKKTLEVPDIDHFKSYVTDLYEKTCEEADALGDLIVKHDSTMEKFIDITEHFQKNVVNTGVTPAIHLAKIITSQFAAFQSLIQLIDQSLVTFGRANKAIIKNYG